MPRPHDRANRGRLQEGQATRICRTKRWSATRFERGSAVTGSLEEIIIPPNFRQATALLGCEKIILRWPGPFDSGFLSPQPPGVVGIGPVRRKFIPTLGQRELVLLFLRDLVFEGSSFRGASETSEPVIHNQHDRRGMHSGPAHPRCAIAHRGRTKDDHRRERNSAKRRVGRA